MQVKFCDWVSGVAGKAGFFSESRQLPVYGVRTASLSNCMNQRVHIKNPEHWLPSISKHTDSRMGSAAVPYPRKVTRISRMGQRSTKIRRQRQTKFYDSRGRTRKGTQLRKFMLQYTEALIVPLRLWHRVEISTDLNNIQIARVSSLEPLTLCAVTIHV